MHRCRSTLASFAGSHVVFLAGLLFLGSFVSRADAAQPTRLTPKPQPNAALAIQGAQPTHILAASYYSVLNQVTASLMLNNKGPNSINITPTLFDLNGNRYDGAAVAVPGNSYKVLDLKVLSDLAGPSFQEGNLQIAHNGTFLEVGSAVNVTQLATSLSYYEQLVEPAAMFKSSSLEGQWWMPSISTTLKLPITNVTGTAVTATIKARTTQGGSGTSTVVLGAHQTRVLDVPQNVLGGVPITLGGAISVTHTGSPGAVIARTSATNFGLGYSASFELTDPGNAKMSALHGAGLRVASIAGEELTTYCVVYNRGTSSSVLNAKIPYTTINGSEGTASPAPLTVGAGAVVVFDTSAALSGLLRDNVASAGIELRYSTAPGTVVASVVTVSTSKTHVFRVPLTDPESIPSSTGGYPWLVSNDSSTLVYVKNVDSAARQFQLQFDFNGGAYTVGVRTLAPGQTYCVDIRKIRDQQTEDEEGQIVPLTADKGQVFWSAEDDARYFIGRAEQVDVGHAISSSYACDNLCGNSFEDGRVEPGFIQTGVGSVVPFVARETRSNSFGLPFLNTSMPARGPVTWSSSNDSYVSINPSTGVASAHPAGIGQTVTITATWNVCIRTSTGFCGPNPPPQAPCCVTHCQAFSATATFVVADIDVRLYVNGSDKTDAINDVLVGQRIICSAQVRNAGRRPSVQYSWAVPDFPVGGYTPTAGPTTVSESVPLDQKETTFYWTDKVTYPYTSVTCTITVFGISRTVQTGFRVAKPDVNVDVVMKDVAVDHLNTLPVTSDPTKSQLHLGNSRLFENSGIQVTAHALNYSAFPGEYGFIQLVSSSSRSKTYAAPSGGHTGEDASGSGLDTIGSSAFYSIGGTTEPGNKFMFTMADSPGIALYTSSIVPAPSPPVTIVSGSAEDHFTTYVMYKPNTPNAIWIAIKKFTWTWSGTTTFTSGAWSDPGNNRSYGEMQDVSRPPVWAGVNTATVWRFTP